MKLLIAMVDLTMVQDLVEKLYVRAVEQRNTEYAEALRRASNDLNLARGVLVAQHQRAVETHDRFDVGGEA